jgi:hypothetical protein
MARGGTPNNTVSGLVWGDPNNLVLAASLGIRPADVVGRFLLLEHWCLSNLTAVVTAQMVDVIMGDGAAEALVALRIATEVEGGIHLGPKTEAKVEQWRNARDGKVTGGQRTAERAKREGRDAYGQFRSGGDNHSSSPPADRPTEGEHDTSSPPTRVQPSASASASASASPRPEAEKNPPYPPSGGSRARRPGRGEPTPEERDLAMRVLAAITERTEVAYRGSDAHLKLITGRLRSGASYRDLRAVVAFCWAPSGLGWRDRLDGQGQPMKRNLRPETLFGPQAIERYLDPARDWFEKVARPRMTPEELAELGEEAPTPLAPPTPAGEPIAPILTLRAVP